MPQLVVIVEILVAKRQGIHSLADELQYGVLDQLRIAVIVDAGRQSPEHTQLPLDLCNNSPPASEVIRPPSNLATTSRLPRA